MLAVQAAEDLVLCALVRSAITAITASSTTGTAQAHTTLPAPQASITPLQTGAREPSRPQGPQVAQVATVPTAQPAPSAASAGAAAPLAGNVSASSGLVAASGGSLAALLAQPLPMASDAQLAAEATVPASAAATGSTVAASQPLSTSTVALLQPVAAASAVSAFAPAAAPVAIHHQSSSPALAVPRDQQQQTQPRPVAGPAPQGPLAVGGMQATPVPGLHSSSSALPAAPAVVLPYSSAQPTPASAGHNSLLPGSSVQPSANSGNQGVGQQAQAGLPTAVQPVGPGLQGAIVQGRASSGQQKALVGDDIWRLASDVLAAGGTATTVAAVTTAAQQVRHSYAGKACQCLWCNRSDAAAKVMYMDLHSITSSWWSMLYCCLGRQVVFLNVH